MTSTATAKKLTGYEATVARMTARGIEKVVALMPTEAKALPGHLRRYLKPAEVQGRIQYDTASSIWTVRS